MLSAISFKGLDKLYLAFNIKKPLTINARKGLFYMVGPHGRLQIFILLIMKVYLY